MEWVAIAVNIARDPAVHRIATALKLRVPEVVGLLALTFAEMSQHAPDGNIADVPDSLLESWSGFHGKRLAFATQFRAELCDASGLVTAWEKYNGASIRRAKAARERTRNWREQRTSHDASQNANGTHTRMHTERVSVCRTEQDSTGPDQTDREQPPPTREASIAETELAALCGEHYPPVLRFLEARPRDKREDWARDLLGLVGPLTGNLPEDLARACTDGHLADPPVTNARTLRIFVGTCRDERRRGSDRPALTVSSGGPANEDAWSEALEVVGQLTRGQLNADAFANLDPRVRAGFKAVGGWTALRDLKPDSLPHRKREYLAAYGRTNVPVSA